jgi:hypothetical protein
VPNRLLLEIPDSGITIDNAFDQIAAEVGNGCTLGVKPLSSGNAEDWKIEVPAYPSAILKVQQIIAPPVGH